MKTDLLIEVEVGAKTEVVAVLEMAAAVPSEVEMGDALDSVTGEREEGWVEGTMSIGLVRYVYSKRL